MPGSGRVALVRRAWLLLRDGRPRTGEHIARELGVGTAAATARVRDLRKPEYGAHVVVSFRGDDRRWYYAVVPTFELDAPGGIAALVAAIQQGES